MGLLGAWQGAGTDRGAVERWGRGIRGGVFAQRGHSVSYYRGGGGIGCQVRLAVVNLAVGNLAEAPGFRVVNLADTPRKQA